MRSALRPRRLAVLGLALALVIGLGTTGDVRAATAQDAEAFIRDLGTEAIEKLSDESVPIETRRQTFREIVHKGFAIDAISRFVLGRYARVASDQEMSRFQDVFLRVVTQRFLPLFAGYSTEDFKIEGAKDDPRSENLFLVRSRLRVPNGGNFARAGWRVQDRDGSLKIVDVLAEGVSMAITLRGEYGSVIKQNGGQVSALIAKLEENVEKGAYKADSLEQAIR
jgi:phospholipid transport system substrate-binding protein